MYLFDIIVETPKGYSEKFNFDKKMGLFRLKKLLPIGMVFPFDFGYIPDTLGQDGDPLDALLLSEIKSFPGCLMECRLLGGMICEQKSNGKTIRNDRFLFVPVESKQFVSNKRMEDIDQTIMNELISFFIQYNLLEGKEFRVLELVEDEEASLLIKKH